MSKREVIKEYESAMTIIKVVWNINIIQIQTQQFGAFLCNIIFYHQ